MRRMDLWNRSTCGARGRRAGARAFSLAEMMVALIILGFGLLVIGAALPIGYRYTQQSTDLANGEVAVEGLLDQLEQYLRMSHDDAFGLPVGSARPCIDPIARPRQERLTVPTSPTRVPSPASEPRDWWEPRIKVWPLLPEVIDFNADTSNAGAISSSMLTSRDPAAYDCVRNMTLGMARQWLSTQPYDTAEWAADPMFTSGPNPGENFPVYLEAADANRTLPGIPLGMLAYPPVESVDPNVGLGSLMRIGGVNDWRFDPPSTGFGGGNNAAGVLSFAGQLAKIKDRRVTFAVFYRRVDYGDPGPNQIPGTAGQLGPGDDNVGDPTVYELIVVAMRRPTNQHRYPVFDIAAANGMVFASSLDYRPPVPMIGGRRASSPVPIPMLVSFLPNKGGGDWVLDQVTATPPPPPLFINVSDRVLNTPASAPETITVRASEWVGSMLPEGSVFIPAVNDDWADALNPILPDATSPLLQASARVPFRLAGFLPHSPQALPIYTVKERRFVSSTQPPHYLITFDCNGVFPWAHPNPPLVSTYGPGPADWPVWIIPPAFVETDRNGQPVFDESATVLSVGRRIVRIPQNP
jgi:type II secretory pathway pseudopilin PulG